MAFTPISNTVPQYEENGVAASGYFIKFYESGTTTPTAMATDSTGTTLLDKCELNTEGYPINGSSAVFIPHINKKYKIALFRNAADADANDLASAAWPAVDGLFPAVTSEITYIEGIDSVSDIEGLIAEIDNQQISLKGWHPDSDMGGGILYWDAAKPKSEHNGGTVFSPTVPFSATTGDYLDGIGETDAGGGGCWVRIYNIVSIDFFGALGSGLSVDDTDSFLRWGDFVHATGCKWFIPCRNYYIDLRRTIKLRSSGEMLGTISTPRSNLNPVITIVRDDNGVVEDSSLLTNLSRGQVDIGAHSVSGESLSFVSTEVQIERIGSGGVSYKKEEFIRCGVEDKKLTTALVNTYNNQSSLTVTSFKRSRAITIKGLTVNVLNNGGGAVSDTGYIICERDNVTLSDASIINETPNQPLAVAITIHHCADVTLVRPAVSGFNYDGLGYGVLAANTIGLTIRDASFTDCRHGYAGIYDTDTLLERGVYASQIDSHWGNRLVSIDSVILTTDDDTAVNYAGYDIALIRPVVFGGRSLLTIRNDTPSMGGSVLIDHPKVVSTAGSGIYYVFGYSSENGPIGPYPTYTNKPTLPDRVEVISPSIKTSTADGSYVYYLGQFPVPHTTWGDIVLSGQSVFNGVGTFNGILCYKDSTYQQDRTTCIEFTGSHDFTSTVYATALDTSYTGGINISIDRCAGDLRYSGYSVSRLRASNCTISSIDSDNSVFNTDSIFKFNSCEFNGGGIGGYLDRTIFNNCNFSGAYSNMPAKSSFISCTREVSIGTPVDILHNINEPLVE